MARGGGGCVGGCGGGGGRERGVPAWRRWTALVAVAALAAVFLPLSAHAVVLTAESDWASSLNGPHQVTESPALRGLALPEAAPTSHECVGVGAWACRGVGDGHPLRHHRPPPLHLHGHGAHGGHGGRHGPFFEDGAGPAHVTARAGDTARLDCRVGLLHGKTVTWLHRRGLLLHLLTVGRVLYSADARLNLAFRYPSNWRLEIERVAARDEGVYECQVATHPPRVRRVFLTVTAPELHVLDEGGRAVRERYYKAGSALELRCVAAGGGAGERPSWRRQGHGGQQQHSEQQSEQQQSGLAHGLSVNVSSLPGGGSVAALRVSRAQKHHSGNYTCSLGSVASAAVAVHVLNGEEPAAVQHGGGAGGARPSSLLLACSSALPLALALALAEALPPLR